MTHLRHYLRLLLTGPILRVLIQAPAMANPPPSEWHVEKVVLLMRHGVRSALSREKIESLSNGLWPDFGVADGQLTAHGRAALILWGRYHRRQFAQKGLLPASGPLHAAQIGIFASEVPRAIDSAKAFMEGMAPGNDLSVMHDDMQRWFHPRINAFANGSDAYVEQTVMNALGMPLDEAQDIHRAAIERVERMLGVPDRRLSAMPWRIRPGETSTHISPLYEITDLVETVRMQYANGFPLGDVGFGTVADQPAVSRLSELQTVDRTLTLWPRAIAALHGGNMFSKLAETLMEGADDSGAADEKPVTIFVGHDTNLIAMHALLNFPFCIPDHAPNHPNPGAMLMFERVRHVPSGERFIRICHISPTLDQIRHLSPFGDATPPFVACFEPPAAWQSPGAHLIPLRSFVALAVQGVRDTGPMAEGECRGSAGTGFTGPAFH